MKTTITITSLILWSTLSQSAQGADAICKGSWNPAVYATDHYKIALDDYNSFVGQANTFRKANPTLNTAEVTRSYCNLQRNLRDASIRAQERAVNAKFAWYRAQSNCFDDMRRRGMKQMEKHADAETFFSNMVKKLADDLDKYCWVK